MSIEAMTKVRKSYIFRTGRTIIWTCLFEISLQGHETAQGLVAKLKSNQKVAKEQNGS